jgi:hypothetical protein
MFGVFFMLVAVLILVTIDTSVRWGALLAAVLVGGLGLDAVVSAFRKRQSLLARIGPLP